MLSDQEKKELRQQIKSNQHEIFVVSIEEMDAIVRSSPAGRLPHIKNAWQQWKGNAGFFQWKAIVIERNLPFLQ